MSSNTARRRRPDSTENEKVEPMDEIEQEQQVQRLKEDAQEQMELIHGIFSRVCEAAMFLCLVLGVASQDVWCWVHVVTSILLHWGASSLVRQGKSGAHQYLPLLALLILVGVFVPQGLNDRQSTKIEEIQNIENMHHLVLAGSNVITMLGALYLKKDAETTNKQIAELEKSKYHYKSL